MAERLIEFLGTGRRKTSVARVRISSGTGEIIVNGKPLGAYCYQEVTQKMALSPLVSADISDKIDARISVFGGGISGQAGAIRLGIARALCEMDPQLRPILKKAGHLTRDGRMKERKKSGQPGARKRFQFSKR
ncbi:MAG: 30S ribosomal protein S9 [Puniceicoccales bacterium]|jgi:small subunit ribosomal protein S9|nr:30S ribosomal protein S9 [Puniceicoccales bacterium]